MQRAIKVVSGCCRQLTHVYLDVPKEGADSSLIPLCGLLELSELHLDHVAVLHGFDQACSRLSKLQKLYLQCSTSSILTGLSSLIGLKKLGLFYHRQRLGLVQPCHPSSAGHLACKSRSLAPIRSGRA